MVDYWERKARLLYKETDYIKKSGLDRPLRKMESSVCAKGDKPKLQGLQLASYISESIVDGPGIRFVLFAQGCLHACQACHNPQTHSMKGGFYMSFDEIISIYEEEKSCRGITLSGGEPFLQADAMAKVAERIHKLGGDVVTYTGYRLEKLESLAIRDKAIKDLLVQTDLLIDGPFVVAKKSIKRPFVGSSNQRLISLSAKGEELLKDIPHNLSNNGIYLKVKI